MKTRSLWEVTYGLPHPVKGREVYGYYETETEALAVVQRAGLTSAQVREVLDTIDEPQDDEGGLGDE